VIGRLQNYTVPAFLNYGCDNSDNHNFSEVQTIYGESGSSVLSGIFVFTWFPPYEENRDAGRYMHLTIRPLLTQRPGLIDIERGTNITTRPNYLSLSSQLASIHPSLTSLSFYTPTKTPPSTCSGIQAQKTFSSSKTLSIDISTYIPHVSSAKLCSCMMNTLACVSSQKDLNAETILNNYCDFSPACRGVVTKSSIETFGSYWGCTTMEKASWVLSQLYQISKSPSNCTEGGGLIQVPLSDEKQSAECKMYLKKAGPEGTGRITNISHLQFTDDDPTLNTSGLSRSAKIGIALGVSVFVLFLLGIAIILQRRRMRAKHGAEKNDMVIPKTELPAEATKEQMGAALVELYVPETYELIGNDVPRELEGESALAEADSGAQLHEMSGDIRDADK
jgi:glycosyl hydrolase family 72 (putative glucanosyltransferase)